MTKPRAQNTAVLVRLPVALHRAVKKRAANEERSMAQMIRYALRLYVDS